ncbi:MAG: 3-deoxy-8-phosphooctulonate synthase [Saprospiraceae bacterium]|nr:3-deoxy-8-phosphooctulonate synthase [Saprospiraceae bacterium]
MNYQKLKEQDRFFLIAGPCAIEGEEICLSIAERLVKSCDRLSIPLIFKGSYKKANRSRIDSFTGIGDEKALRVLEKVKNEFGIPVTTDIHTEQEASWAGEVVDVLQIPAFLCRQTDLLVAAAKTNKIVNIKKGQFMSPESMQYAAMKVRDSGNDQAMITERGTTFGYSDLIVDFRGIPTMQKMCEAPVVLDCTHSLQQPNQGSGITGGRPNMIETIVKAGIAVGADGLFIETHPDPSNAKSDGANMLQIDQLDRILEKACRIQDAL